SLMACVLRLSSVTWVEWGCLATLFTVSFHELVSKSAPGRFLHDASGRFGLSVTGHKRDHEWLVPITCHQVACLSRNQPSHSSTPCASPGSPSVSRLPRFGRVHRGPVRVRIPPVDSGCIRWPSRGKSSGNRAA